MAHWLLKSEPYKFSWEDQLKKGEGRWEKRVRNYQARNNLSAMTPGDQAFFYHSNEGKEVVGILEITQKAYPDPDDETGKFVTVGVKPKKSMTAPVTLADIKSHPDLQNIALVRQSRLSVMPLTDKEWRIICEMGHVL
ncbi:MAG: EVE domain-containing protein [Alphaproteobacteria bacterium]|nr:EVE domain-containing protein [Alphaproteobacteria bacterium]